MLEKDSLSPLPLFALQEILQSLFDETELIQFLHLKLGSQGPELVSSLPSGASLLSLTYSAVVGMERRGLISPLLFDALARERPWKEEEIRSVQRTDGWSWNKIPIAPFVTRQAQAESLRSNLAEAAEALQDFIETYRSPQRDGDCRKSLYRLRGKFEYLRLIIRDRATGSLSKEVLAGLINMMDIGSQSRAALTDEEYTDAALATVRSVPEEKLLGTLEMCKAYIMMCAEELTKPITQPTP